MVEAETALIGAAVGLAGAEATGVTNLTGGGSGGDDEQGGGGNASPDLSGLFQQLGSIRAQVAAQPDTVPSGRTQPSVPDLGGLADAFADVASVGSTAVDAGQAVESIGQNVLPPSADTRSLDQIRTSIEALSDGSVPAEILEGAGKAQLQQIEEQLSSGNLSFDQPTNQTQPMNQTDDTALFDEYVNDPIITGAEEGGKTVGRAPFAVAGGIADGFVSGLNDAVSDARERGRENNQGYYAYSDDGDSLAQDLISGDTDNPVDDAYNNAVSDLGFDNLRSDTPLFGGSSDGGGSSSDGGDSSSSSSGRTVPTTDTSDSGVSSPSSLQSAISGGGDNDGGSSSSRGSYGPSGTTDATNSTSTDTSGGDSVGPSDTNGGDSDGDSGGGGIASKAVSTVQSAAEALI
jgi:hypothetical protein